MSQESETVVTIHRRPILSHHRACGFGYPFGPQALQLTIGITLRTSSPYPQSYVGGLTRKIRVYIVELSSISTTCGLCYNHLRPLTPPIHNWEPFLNYHHMPLSYDFRSCVSLPHSLGDFSPGSHCPSDRYV